MKKFHTMKQKIIFYVMSTAILLTVLTTTILSAGNVRSTNTVLLDNMQTTARIAAQSISSNLHLLTERMYNLSQNVILTDPSSTADAKKDCLADTKLQIEFVWLSAYDTMGKKLYGDSNAPDSIADQAYYSYLGQTGNIVIGDPYEADGILQLCVGIPIKSGEETAGYLVGSYKYDVLSDVLSMLIIGSTGSACIVNPEGLMIASRDTSDITLHKNIYDLASSASATQAFHNMLSYQTGSDKIQMDGCRQYAGYAPIPGTNWALLIHAPQREFMGTVRSSLILSVLFTVFLLVAATMVVTSVSNKISRSLSSATNRLQLLAEGNLTDPVTAAETNDETAVLTDALSKTIASLNAYIQDIQTCLGALSDGDYTIRIPDNFDGDFCSIRDSLHHIAESLNQTMVRMNRSSQAVNQNSQDVSANAMRLKEGAVSQEELLHQLADSMELITSSIEKNRDNVLQIEQCAQNATDKTSLGGKHMENMLSMMAEINQAVEEISKISKFVEDISFQTNLLALNASIEASRAGESGRGFAVVASQMSQLSEQTTDALQQTADIIQSSTDLIRKGLTTADETATAFQEIQTVTEQYREISAQLAATTQEQTNTVDCVSEKLDSLKEIADQNRELAEEANQVAANSLSQSESLHQYVSQVKLKESEEETACSPFTK